MDLFEWLAEWEAAYKQIEDLVMPEIDEAPREFQLAVKKIDIGFDSYLKMLQKTICRLFHSYVACFYLNERQKATDGESRLGTQREEHQENGAKTRGEPWSGEIN